MALLAFGQFMLSMGNQTRIMNFGDSRVAVPAIWPRQRHCRNALSSGGQGFQTGEKHPGVKRTHRGAAGPQIGIDVLSRSIPHCRPPRRRHNALGRLCIWWRNAPPNPRPAPKAFVKPAYRNTLSTTSRQPWRWAISANSLNIGNFNQRVGRRFQKQKAGIGLDGGFPGRRIGQVDKIGLPRRICRNNSGTA